MSKQIKADHDSWRATVDPSSADGRTVVFFCTSNGQRPWRVVRVDDDELDGSGGVDGLSTGDLRALFDRSESMNVSPS